MGSRVNVTTSKLVNDDLLEHRKVPNMQRPDIGLVYQRSLLKFETVTVDRQLEISDLFRKG